MDEQKQTVVSYNAKSTKNKRKEEEEHSTTAYKTLERSTILKQYHFFVMDEIGDPSDYVEMISKILTATENDVVYIHLNTSGGRLDTGMHIINAMRATNAHVVTILEAKAYSLGTLIFLSGDELQVHENCLMMFHHYTGGVVGKGHEQQAELDATNKWFAKLMKKIAMPFLAQEDVDAVLRGTDIWMDSDEVRKRLKKMFSNPEVQEEKAKAAKKTGKIK